MSITTPPSADTSAPDAEAVIRAHLSCSRCAPVSPPRAGRPPAACAHVQQSAADIAEALTVAGLLAAPQESAA